MTQVRGASEPTSGSQDHVELDEAALDHALSELTARASAWASLGAAARARLLERVVRDTFDVAEEWNDAACAAKGYDPAGPEGGEEMFSGVGTFVRMAQLFRQLDARHRDEGSSPVPGPGASQARRTDRRPGRSGDRRSTGSSTPGSPARSGWSRA